MVYKLCAYNLNMVDRKMILSAIWYVYQHVFANDKLDLIFMTHYKL